MMVEHFWATTFDPEGHMEFVFHRDEMTGFMQAVIKVTGDEDTDPNWHVEFGPCYTDEQMVELGLIDQPKQEWEILSG